MRTSPARPALPARPARLGAALVTLGLVLAACGLQGDGATPAPSPPAPDAPPAPAPGPDSPVEVPDVVPTLTVFLVRSAPTTFYVEPVDIDVTTLFDDVASLAGRGPEARELNALDPSTRLELSLRALLATSDALADGLRVLGVDPELSSSVPAGTRLLGVSLDGGVVTIDLGGTMAAEGTSGGSAQEMTFAEQLAHTVSVEPSVTGVRLRIGGVLVDELWGHLDWSVPIGPDPFALSPVTIESPVHDALIVIETTDAAAPFVVEIRGQATVFEATVLITARDAAGTLITEGFLTASTGAPERGTWVWQLELPGPGRYVVEVAESDPSDGEGRPPYSVSRSFEVR
jgi:hypothetical protein